LKKRISYIIKFAGKYKLKFITVFLIVMVTTAIVAFYPFLFGKLIDALFYDKDISTFFKIVLIYLVIYLINQVLHYRLDMTVVKLGNDFSFDIKRSVFHKVLTYKSKELSHLNSGDIISRVNKDAEEPLSFVYHDIIYGMSAVLDFLMCFGIIAYINVTLAVVVLGMSAVSFAVSKVFERKLVPLYQTLTKTTAKNSNWLFEVLNGIRDLMLMVSVNRCFDKYMKIENEVVKSYEKIAQKEIIAERINDAVKLLATLMMYSLAAIFIIKDIVTLGGLVACIDYYNRMMLMMDRIYVRIFRVSKKVVSIDRLIEVDARESEVEQEKFSINSGEIVFKDVSFGYNDETEVLSKANLHIKAGEKIALVGRSGEGKSTVAELICRLYDVDSGEILIDGKNISDVDVHELRKQIGIVNQKVTIFDGSIRYNLVFFDSDEYDQDIWNALKQVEMDKVIEQLPEGLNTQLSISGMSLSGGQYQRLALARAYLKRAPIMIFDESTSAIDGKTEDSIINAWDELYRENTLIVIAHRFSTIMRCDRIAVLENGKIVACDSHDALMKSCETYKNLFREQSNELLMRG